MAQHDCGEVKVKDQEDTKSNTLSQEKKITKISK